MSTRERWIVYPLLFLTLGITLRDKIIPPRFLGGASTRLLAGEIATGQLRCKQLRVETAVCDRLESQQSECRALIVNGPSGRPVVVAGAQIKSGAGTVETFTAKGEPQVRLLSTDTGGMVTTIGHGGKVILVMGHAGQHFGVFAQVPELGPPIPLTVPWRYQSKQLSPPSPKTPAKPKPGRATDKAAAPGEGTACEARAAEKRTLTAALEKSPLVCDADNG